MSGHAIGTHDAALRLALGVDVLPDVRADMALAYSRPFKGQKILDIACGPNPFPWVAGGPDYIAEREIKVTCDLPGVDLPASHAVLWSDRHFEVDLDRDPWTRDVGREYDLILALEIIEHIENPWRFLRLISELLAPGGVVVISSPDITSTRARGQFNDSGRLPWFSSAFDEVGHISPIFPYIFEEMCRRAGLRVTGEAFNEPPPHWVEQATADEVAGVADSVRVWRVEK